MSLYLLINCEDCPKCGDHLVAIPSWRGMCSAGDPVHCEWCDFRGELDGDEDGWSVREVKDG